MKFLAPLALASLVVAAGGTAALGNNAPGLQPYQMVRSLQLVQDRVAVGDHAALPIQRKLLEMIDARLRTASAAELMQPRNLHSMMVYAMSGGNPETLRNIVHRMHVEEHDGRIIAGILSYLNGATKTAALTLRDVEPLKEPIETGAFLALIKGSVIALEDPTAALGLLDQARLLAPGTLVEEAALRRSVGLAATIHDAARFLRSSDQYVRIYLRSPYASQFADSFVSGVIDLRDTIDLAEVDAIVGMMSPEQRKVLYLRIARRAALDGLVALSTYAAQRADAIGGAEEETRDPRVLLYTSLTDVATAPVDDVRQRIARIDRSRLSGGDRRLLDAVLAVSGEIIRDPVGEAEPKVIAADPELPDETVPIEAEPETGHQAEGPANADARPDGDASAPPAEAGAIGMDSAAASPAPESGTEDAGLNPSQLTLSAGRKKLAEIDELLAGAAK